MPTSGAGVYTVPAGINPVVAGTVIQDTWANPTLADVAQGITDRLDRSGRGAMLAPLKLFDGTSALPGLVFANEPTSGLFRVGAGVIGFSILATEVFRVTSTGISFTAPGLFVAQLGAVGAPSFTFTGDLNTGMWSPGADLIAWSVGGVESLRMSGSGLVSTKGIELQAGGTSVTVNGTTGALQLGVATAAITSVTDAFVVWGSNAQPLVSAVSGASGSLLLAARNLATAHIIFGTLNANRAAILSTGEVLIGRLSSVAALYKLQVGDGSTNANVLFNATDQFSIAVRNGASGTYQIGASASASPDLILSNNGGTQRLRLTDDGRLFGSALHNNGGSVTGTTNQYVASGTYAPTLTNTTNISLSTASVCSWMRVGNVVTVAGGVSITCTANNAQTELDMSLPIPSNLANTSDLGGAGANISNLTAVQNPAVCWADGANDRANFSFFNQSGTGANIWNFSYQYVIL